jgi:hypothetical protein
MDTDIYSSVLKDSKLQAKLVLATGKSFPTIWRWANRKDERLTTIKATSIIDEHLNGESGYFLNLIQENDK